MCTVHLRRWMIVDVSTPWGPFHHTRGLCHDIKSLFYLLTLHSRMLTLALSPSAHLPVPFAGSIFSLCLSPRSLLSLYVPQLSSQAHVSLRMGTEPSMLLSLFLDLSQMRIACRMWKRSGTNGWNGPKANHPGRNHIGLAAGAASVVASACSCRSPWVLFWAWGLGLGSRGVGS